MTHQMLESTTGLNELMSYAHTGGYSSGPHQLHPTAGSVAGGGALTHSSYLSGAYGCSGVGASDLQSFYGDPMQTIRCPSANGWYTPSPDQRLSSECRPLAYIVSYFDNKHYNDVYFGTQLIHVQFLI